MKLDEGCAILLPNLRQVRFVERDRGTVADREKFANEVLSCGSKVGEILSRISAIKNGKNKRDDFYEVLKLLTFEERKYIVNRFHQLNQRSYGDGDYFYFFFTLEELVEETNFDFSSVSLSQMIDMLNEIEEFTQRTNLIPFKNLKLLSFTYKNTKILFFGANANENKTSETPNFENLILHFLSKRTTIEELNIYEMEYEDDFLFRIVNQSKCFHIKKLNCNAKPSTLLPFLHEISKYNTKLEFISIESANQTLLEILIRDHASTIKYLSISYPPEVKDTVKEFLNAAKELKLLEISQEKEKMIGYNFMGFASDKGIDELFKSISKDSKIEVISSNESFDLFSLSQFPHLKFLLFPPSELSPFDDEIDQNNTNNNTNNITNNNNNSTNQLDNNNNNNNNQTAALGFGSFPGSENLADYFANNNPIISQGGFFGSFSQTPLKKLKKEIIKIFKENEICFPELEKLYILSSHSGISSVNEIDWRNVPKGGFQSLKYLFLDVTSNKISSIKLSEFGFPSLKNIQFNTYQGTHIDDDSINELINKSGKLEEIYLIGGKMKNILLNRKVENLKSFKIWDPTSKIRIKELFQSIINYAPNIEYFRVQEDVEGKAKIDSLSILTNQLTHLKKLTLPLISLETLISIANSVPSLEEFIFQSYNFDNFQLPENCFPSLMTSSLSHFQSNNLEASTIISIILGCPLLTKLFLPINLLNIHSFSQLYRPLSTIKTIFSHLSDDQLIEVLKVTPNLNEISLMENRNLTSAIFSSISKYCSNISSIHVHNMENLCNNFNLENSFLNLTSLKIERISLLHINFLIEIAKKAPKLSKLEINFAKWEKIINFSEEDSFHPKNIHNKFSFITSLQLKQLDEINFSYILCLCPNLKNLSVSITGSLDIDQRFIEYIDLDKITYLSIQNYNSHSRSASNEIIESNFLNNLFRFRPRNLTELIIQNFSLSFTQTPINNLPAFESLKRMEIMGLDDGDLCRLVQHIPNLSYLTLHQTKCSKLSDLPPNSLLNLKHISLGGKLLEDEAIERISVAGPNIEKIQFSRLVNGIFSSPLIPDTKLTGLPQVPNNNNNNNVLFAGFNQNNNNLFGNPLGYNDNNINSAPTASSNSSSVPADEISKLLRFGAYAVFDNNNDNEVMQIKKEENPKIKKYREISEQSTETLFKGEKKKTKGSIEARCDSNGVFLELNNITNGSLPDGKYVVYFFGKSDKNNFIPIALNLSTYQWYKIQALQLINSNHSILFYSGIIMDDNSHYLFIHTKKDYIDPFYFSVDLRNNFLIKKLEKPKGNSNLTNIQFTFSLQHFIFIFHTNDNINSLVDVWDVKENIWRKVIIKNELLSTNEILFMIKNAKFVKLDQKNGLLIGSFIEKENSHFSVYQITLNNENNVNNEDNSLEISIIRRESNGSPPDDINHFSVCKLNDGNIFLTGGEISLDEPSSLFTDIYFTYDLLSSSWRLGKIEYSDKNKPKGNRFELTVTESGSIILFGGMKFDKGDYRTRYSGNIFEFSSSLFPPYRPLILTNQRVNQILIPDKLFPKLENGKLDLRITARFLTDFNLKDVLSRFNADQISIIKLEGERLTHQSLNVIGEFCGKYLIKLDLRSCPSHLCENLISLEDLGKNCPNLEEILFPIGKTNDQRDYSNRLELDHGKDLEISFANCPEITEEEKELFSSLWKYSLKSKKEYCYEDEMEVNEPESFNYYSYKPDEDIERANSKTNSEFINLLHHFKNLRKLHLSARSFPINQKEFSQLFSILENLSNFKFYQNPKNILFEHYLDILSKYGTRIRSFYFPFEITGGKPYYTTDSISKAVQSLPALTHLDFSNIKNNFSAKWLSNLSPHLTTLKIGPFYQSMHGGNGFQDEDIKLITSKCPNIVKLSIHVNDILSQNSFHLIANTFTNLKSLTLPKMANSNEIFEIAKNCKKLKFLYCDLAKQIEPSDWAKIGEELISLKKIIFGYDCISSKGLIAFIEKNNQMEELTLASAKLSRKALEFVAINCKSLRKFRVPHQEIYEKKKSFIIDYNFFKLLTENTPNITSITFNLLMILRNYEKLNDQFGYVNWYTQIINHWTLLEYLNVIVTDFDNYSPVDNYVGAITKLLIAIPSLREVHVYLPEDTGDDGSCEQEKILQNRFPGAKIKFIM